MSQSTPKTMATIPLLAGSGALWGLIAGLITAMVFLFLNPIFIDTVSGFLLWMVLLPMAAGLLAGLVFGLLGLMLPSSPGGGLSAIPTLGLGMIILAAFLIPAVPLGLGLGLFGSPFASFLVFGGLFLLVGLFCCWLVLIRRRGAGSGPRVLSASRNIALVVLVLLVGFWSYSAVIRAPDHDLSDNGLEMLVIGLDGVSPIVLDDMVAKEQLPFFASVMSDGCYGELTSITPIFSPMIWTSIATGKLPEKHGVADFLNASYLDITAKTVWEVLEEDGKTGLYEWLCTWPPVKLNGFVVPGWLARNTLTYPESLQFIKEIKTAGKTGQERSSKIKLVRAVLQAVRHGVKLSSVADLGKLYVYNGVMKPSRAEIHYKKYLVALGMDGDIFEYLLATEKPKYAFYYHQTIDPISHVYWQYRAPEGFDKVTEADVAQFGEVIGGAYQEVDQVLGQLLDRLGTDLKVMIVSDHGFQSIIDGPQHSGLLVSIRSDGLLDSLQITDLEGFHTMSQLFLTAQIDDVERARQILAEAVDKLGTFWVPDVDLPLFIPELMDNPGDQADYVRIALNGELKSHFMAGQLTQDETVIRYQGGECLLGDLVWRKFSSGVHHPEGVILARGPGIRRGVRLQPGDASVLDVAPTILAMAELPVAHDMDGKVLFELFEGESITPEKLAWVDTYGNGEVKKPIIGQVDGDGTERGLRNKLKSLGYIN